VCSAASRQRCQNREVAPEDDGTTTLTLRIEGPHAGQPLHRSGAPGGMAHAVMILLHGRGATAESILTLADALPFEGMAYFAPQAAGYTWYPNRFLAPLHTNEPWLTSALAAVGDLVTRAGAEGVPPERVVLAGFSQGACLALEYAVRHPRRYGAIVGLSGGLIGPPGTRWNETGSFEGTPAFLGCSDSDFHIPAERVLESADVLRRLNATVRAVLYPGMDHTVSPDEIAEVRALLRPLAPAGRRR
jgi:predicted esterase